MDLGESVRRPRRAPLLLLVVVDHDGGARRGDALLWPLVTAIEGEFPMVISLPHVTLDLPDLHRTHMHRKTRYFPPNLLIPRIEATVKHRLSQTGPTKDPWTSIVLNVQTLIRGQIFPGLTSVLRERFGTFSSNYETAISSLIYHSAVTSKSNTAPNKFQMWMWTPTLPYSLLLSVFPFPRLRWR